MEVARIVVNECLCSEHSKKKYFDVLGLSLNTFSSSQRLYPTLSKADSAG